MTVVERKDAHSRTMLQDRNLMRYPLRLFELNIATG